MGDAQTSPPCEISHEEGRLRILLPNAAEPVPVKAMLLRPLSTRQEVTFLNDDGDELLRVPNLNTLAPACRELVAAELAARYHMPKVLQVHCVETRFGSHYWDVNTDKGPTRFAFKEPGKNVLWLSDDHLVLRDTMGNRYEILSLIKLDSKSRKAIFSIL